MQRSGALSSDLADRPNSWSYDGDHHHGVQFYSQDKFLLEELSGYIGGALRVGDSAIVVATEAHRNGLLQWLTAQGIDLAAASQEGRLIALDASQTLAEFMLEDWPSEERFNHVIGPIIARAASSASSQKAGVSIFGEMVALLLADGKAQAAIRLEQLWNELAQMHSFSALIP